MNFDQMEGIDNKYIDDAIAVLYASVGVKEHIDRDKLTSLIAAHSVKDAIKEVAKYIGLPIEFNITYVPKGYTPDAVSKFKTTDLVSTDARGRGTAGITAQVFIPSNLPLYGTTELTDFPLNVVVSEDCAEHPLSFLAVMAHELSHVLLHSIRHTQKQNEFYTDLTAMMLGFADVMRLGRKVSVTTISGSATTTVTTTYGYLSDENFKHALYKIEDLLRRVNRAKEDVRQKLKEVDEMIIEQKRCLYYFARYIGYLDKNLNKNITEADGRAIAAFHQPNYTGELEKATGTVQKLASDTRSFLMNIKRYDDAFVDKMNKIAERIETAIADLNSKHNRVHGAVATMKKYISIRARIQSFLSLRRQSRSDKS